MNINQLWGELIIEELVRNKTQCFCISPGSRSTPLTLAVAKNPLAKSQVFYDERAASYYALGHSRGSGHPSVLICTSGTAAANYLPAVIEASIEQIPMLILTADRPPELHDSGANQSINQTHLFGIHTRWFFDPGCPSQEFKIEALLSSIDYAISKTLHPLSGPVHINLQFREPFFEKNQSQKIKKYPLNKPYVRYSTSKKNLPNSDINDLIKKLPNSGILSIGRVPRESLVSLRKLAQKLDWPVFADITSGLRLGANCPNRITYYDQLLIEDLESSKWEIDAVLHFGFPPTSKRWLDRWEKKPSAQMIWIAEHEERHDQSHNFRWRIKIEILEFCNQVLNELKSKKRVKSLNKKTLKWLRAGKEIEKFLEQHFLKYSVKKNIDDFCLTRKLTEIIPENHGFFIGNSIPVRAADSFGSGKGADVPTALNRGASGIDGLIASGCGYSSSLKRAVTILLGDLSAIHDLNSFKLLSDSEYPILLVLINNQGGGIFSLLPIADHTKIFENFFVTPHSHNFQGIAKMFNLDYFNPKSINDFELDYKKAVSKNKSAVIEIFSERKNISKIFKDVRENINKNIFAHS